MLRLLASILLLIPALALAQPRIAIIIDDLGYHRSRGESIVNLPGPVTCAVIPQTAHAPALAKMAHQSGKEVILHMPMETDGYAELDVGGLREDMTQEDFVATVDAAVSRIPEARGLNNHMGGILTADVSAMNMLMESLGDHGLFFVDSRTTPQSVAGSLARQHGLAYAGRDIFLDNERDLVAINNQFNLAIALAKRRGQAIVIGHPYPETIEYLQNVIPLLDSAGIELVPVSRLLNRPQMAKANPAAADEPPL